MAPHGEAAPQDSARRALGKASKMAYLLSPAMVGDSSTAEQRTLTPLI